MTEPTGPQPLAGIAVLDVSSVLSGPLTTMILAELGAEVIKVEPPTVPDFTRGTGNASGGMTAYFYNTNRGKRALAVDGRDPRGQTILRQLADRSDVLVQNMRPGKAARIGLDPDECLARNPSLVYASINGYGSTGPAVAEPVYDYVIQAVTGMVDIQRDPSTGRADLTRHFPADKITSHAMVEGILAALFARERDPERRGQHVEVSMHEANLAFFWPDGMMQHSIIGEPDAETVYPGDFYRVYPTIDGGIVLMPLMGPLTGICRAIGHPEWTETGRFIELGPDNLHEFQDVLGAAVEDWTTEEALARFSAHDVPVGPVVPRDQVHEHLQAVARNSVVEHDVAPIGHIRTARPAWRLSRNPPHLPEGAPLLGQHTDEILSELNYDSSMIDILHRDGVIARNPPVD
ncbi:MAG: CoA transferase [Actinomycetota bacterium]|jgi:crotonobetainyl-CoA:carnitine CoA-transferase CaiB-like acyl-CoA transferase|nr:CoA transferase [Actinomycetota bacterium]